MRCKWPFCWDHVGNNGFPVRLRPEFDSKAKIAEPQSLKKKESVSRTVGKLLKPSNRVLCSIFC